MEDQSELDKKYFVDEVVYNCPFCNRRNVVYYVIDDFDFNWSKEKKCNGYIVRCSSCDKKSMHLSFEQILNRRTAHMERFIKYHRFESNRDLDTDVFYSQPTSFFVIDKRIHKTLRELITEAEGCLKMNYLTGASACMRKAIYELLILEEAEGADYESRIKSLKKKHPDSNTSYFDILSHIQGMTSDKVHEQSWDKWDSKLLKLIISALRNIFYEIYVLPQEKEDRALEIEKLRQEVTSKKTKLSGNK